MSLIHSRENSQTPVKEQERTTMKLTEAALQAWVERLMEQQRVIGVQERNHRFVYDTLHQAEDLRLDHDVTNLPPGKYFLPQTETILDFNPSEGYISHVDDSPFILLGVHPYDVVAIRQMDAVFASGELDTPYWRRRARATIIASDVQTPSLHAFCGDMGTATVREGQDILLTRIGVDDYLAEAATPRGEALFTLLGDGVRRVDEEDLLQREQVWAQNREALRQRKLKVRPEDWPALLAASVDDPIWEERAQRCFSCGSCNLVCGTCSCFDVVDEVDWDLQTGNRLRRCDACMVRGFMQVAGGHDFQNRRADRYRHRFFRKGSYMPQRYGFIACTGCGRCASACIADIANPVDLYNELLARHPEAVRSREVEKPSVEGQSVEDKALASVAQNLAKRPILQGLPHEKGVPTVSFTPSPYEPRLQDCPTPTSVFAIYPFHTITARLVEQRRDPYVPELATLVSVRPLTELETFYEFRLDSGHTLGHQPGQFVMLSLMGYGEAPFSIASSPTSSGHFEMVIRKVGTVTTALAQLQPGDKVGLRGPFGTAFPVQDELRGKDVLVVSGGLGIVPVRSAIQYILDHRDFFGRLSIAYGMRSPADELFGEEIKAWRQVRDVEVLECVDRADTPWRGPVCSVTALLPDIPINPGRTMALVCGPPVMYKFALPDLMKLGLTPESIYVSLERRMKCGLGKCGHCQINGVYVCQEGPVFRYADLLQVQEAFK